MCKESADCHWETVEAQCMMVLVGMSATGMNLPDTPGKHGAAWVWKSALLGIFSGTRLARNPWAQSK
jgi:hypothetical protein